MFYRYNKLIKIHYHFQIILDAEYRFSDSKQCLIYCLFVWLLYVQSQQLWSWRDGQFTLPHFFPGQS